MRKATLFLAPFWSGLVVGALVVFQAFWHTPMFILGRAFEFVNYYEFWLVAGLVCLAVIGVPLWIIALRMVKNV